MTLGLPLQSHLGQQLARAGPQNDESLSEVFQASEKADPGWRKAITVSSFMAYPFFGKWRLHQRQDTPPSIPITKITKDSAIAPVRGLRSARSHGIRHRSCSVRRRFGACLRRRSGRKRLPGRPSPRADSRRENKHWRWCRRQRRQCGACVEDEELLVRVEIVLVPINRQLAPCGKRRGKRSV